MLKAIVKPLSKFVCILYKVYRNYILNLYYTSMLGYCGKNVCIYPPRAYTNLGRIYMYDNTNIYQGLNFLSYTGKLIFKKNSGAAQGLTVITGNHHRSVGVWFIENSRSRILDEEKDVIVEEDVWIGANVTLLSGVRIGRGATIGAGSVCHKSIPPYAIVMGNPAKIVGFNYNPEEVIQHETALYPENERLPFELLENNYNKYYINRIKDIKDFLKQ